MIHEITPACSKCPYAIPCMAGQEPVKGVVVCPTCEEVAVLRVGAHEMYELLDSVPLCVPRHYPVKRLKGAFENSIRRIVKKKREETQRFSYSHIPVIDGGVVGNFMVTLCESCATELINEVHDLIFGPGAGPGGSLF